MNPEYWTPPLRDLPPGSLEARKEHLLIEISRERAPRLSLPRVNWTPLRLFALAGAGAAVAAALAFAVVSSPNNGVLVHSPLYTFHAPLASLKHGGGHANTQTSVAASYLAAAARSAGPSAPLANVAALASRLAVLDRDAHGLSGVWFTTTRQLAVSSQSTDRVEGPSTRVFFVVLHGHFVAKKPLFAGRRAGGGAAVAPTGTILTFTIDSKSGDILDVTLGNRSPDAAALGEARHLVFASDRRTP